jgi:tRNA threonylcarbamoyladenosine biosynthesis protein TsaE
MNMRSTIGARPGKAFAQLPPAPAHPLSRDELLAWGEALGASIGRPAIVAVSGELGAGKTTLIQAICRGAGVGEPVTSPTFALVHEYASPRGPVFHLDLYRLRGPEDLTNLAWDDITSGEGSALVLVEWPERAGARLQADALRIALDAEGETRRVRMSR